MRQATHFVSLLAALVLAGCAETAYCHSPAETPEACYEANTHTSDCHKAEAEQPQPREPDYDRRNAI